jgi:iron complex outermembrane receptor protein
MRYGGDTYRDNNVLADFDLDLNTRIANRSFALFGHSTYHFTEAIAASGGLRWTRDQKTIELVHRRLGSGEYIVGAPGTQNEFTHSWSQLTPELGVQWNTTSDALLYLSYAKGYKSGGFNGRPLVDSREVSEPYDPEIVDSYELGAKTRWRDGRMTANAALFYNDYRDMQLTINATPQNYVRNAGAARIRGAELEVVTRVVSDLDLNIAAGFLDAQYTRLDPELEGLRPRLTRDQHLIKAPDWTVNVGLEYRLVRKFGSFELRGDYIYRSKIYHDVFNDPRLTQRAFSLYNAYFGFIPPGRRWDVAVFGTNLGNTRYRISGNSSASFGLAESSFSPPRQLGVTLRVRI